MITIIDYGMGNLHSVQKAFEKNGARVKVSSDPRAIERASKLVLPGVGAFTHAMRELEKRKLTEVIREKILGGTPYLGLCLGLQLLFSKSEEGERVAGLGIIPGSVMRFKGPMKIPHMGWNTLDIKKRGCPVFSGVTTKDYFYFVHSYYGVPEDPSWTLSTTRYHLSFCSSVWKGHVFATQFHPEKSQSSGLRLIKNFIRYQSN